MMLWRGLGLVWASVLTVGGAGAITLQMLGPPAVPPPPAPAPVAAVAPVPAPAPVRRAPALQAALPVPPVPPREAATHPRRATPVAQTRPPLPEPYEADRRADYAEGWGYIRATRPQYNMGYYSYYYPRY